MIEKNLKQKLQEVGVRKVINYLIDDPVQNAPKMIDWVRKHARTDGIESYLEGAENLFRDKDSNWYRYIENLSTDIDDGVLRKFVENFLINAGIYGIREKKRLREEHQCNIPWAILLDPTSACNLHCKGCWAAEYGNKLSLKSDEWESIIQQGKEMGTYVFIYSGGEPLVRRKEIIEMCERHSDCLFLAFTNGTLIDEAFADEMLRVKNFIPAISVEGYADQTDARRGEGCYDAVIRAMDILQRRKLLFGMSCCYTSQNTEIIGSESFFDDMIARGVKFAWFFTYMPIGEDAVPDLMSSPAQREFMYHKLRAYRKTKPLFTMDFWNDGEYVDGCIAGGRCYLHINANGDIEPCAFVHYSDSNIKEKTILEACKSPLFMEYHHNQPFNDNMLRPCPLLDNPQYLEAMVMSSGAISTDMQKPEDVSSLCGKCHNMAGRWADTADRLWYDH